MLTFGYFVITLLRSGCAKILRIHPGMTRTVHLVNLVDSISAGFRGEVKCRKKKDLIRRELDLYSWKTDPRESGKKKLRHGLERQPYESYEVHRPQVIKIHSGPLVHTVKISIFQARRVPSVEKGAAFFLSCIKECALARDLQHISCGVYKIRLYSPTAKNQQQKVKY